EIAATISPDGDTNGVVEVYEPERLDSLALDGAALLLWHAPLPDAAIRPIVQEFISAGGQVMFFPPMSVVRGRGIADAEQFQGVGWGDWIAGKPRVMGENWRSDHDLFSATDSGVGLPVGELELAGYAPLSGDAELTRLA